MRQSSRRLRQCAQHIDGVQCVRRNESRLGDDQINRS